MYSPNILKLFGQLVNVAYYCCAIPYYWDYKQQKLIVTKSKVQFFCCYYLFIFSIVFVLAMLERIIWLLTKKVEDDPILFILFVVLVFAMLIPITILGLLFLQLKEIEIFANSLFQYFKFFEGISWYN